MKRISELSVVLPVYNEEVAIIDVVEQVHRKISCVADTFEIILVDDGSVDQTAVEITKLQQKLDSLVIKKHESNRGYGEALRTGFDTAQYEWIFQMDSDGQFDIGEIDNLIEWVDKYDVVVGYRKKRADAWHRVFLTWGYVNLLNILFRLPIRDVGCAFKLFKQWTWRDVQPIESRDHKIFLVEWIWKLHKMGIKIKEVPVFHYDRRGGRATGARLDVTWMTIKQLIVLRGKTLLEKTRR